MTTTRNERHATPLKMILRWYMYIFVYDFPISLLAAGSPPRITPTVMFYMYEKSR
jgi:hypothetical protein